MSLKQICFAISLPVVAAFLSIYWFKQRKKINDDEDESSNLTMIKQLDCRLNKSTDERSTIDQQINDTSNDAFIVKETLEKEKLDDVSNNESINRSIEKSFNKTLDRSLNKMMNNSNDKSVCRLLDEDNFKKTDQSIVKESNEKDQNVFLINNLSTNDDLKHNLSTKSTDDNRSSTEIESTNVINLNNNDNDFKSKLEQNTDVHLDNLTNKSIQQQSTNEQFNIDDVNENTKIDDLNTSKIDDQILVIGEEAFEINPIPTTSTISSSLNNESLCFTDQFATSLTFESKDDNNTTFNTANDSSLNATINTSSIDSIDSLKNVTLSLENCSTKTLCSSLEKSLKKDEKHNFINNDELSKDENKSNEEVKEDYLDKQITNAHQNSSTNSNQTKVDDLDNDVNFEYSKEQNLSTAFLNSTVNVNNSIKNDKINDENDEKFLNVTVDEFKNDSKTQIIEDVIEELRNKVSEQLTYRTDENSIKVDETLNECNVSSDKLENSLNRSEDDSICIVYDGPQTTDLKKTKKSTSQSSNQSKQESKHVLKKEPETIVNLDESDELEVLFDSGKPVPKMVINGNLKSTINNRPQTKNNNLNGSSKSQKDYCFEIPQPLVGLLIGHKGGFVNNVMRSSNTVIVIKDHPTMLDLMICHIKGTQNEIEKALSIIRERFPIKKFPHVTLNPSNPNLISVEPISLSSNLVLPDGVNVEVLLSNFVSPSHVFLQLPTHPTFATLQRLDEYMIETYNNNETPKLNEPAVNIICAIPHGNNWYRAMITNIEQDNCVVRLLDYGGFVTVPKSSLRQVQRDYMSIPFQAIECFLANIKPINGVWSQESLEFFKQITEKQILQSYTVLYTEERFPFIHLFRAENNRLVNINEELCRKGYAYYVD